MSSSPTFIDQIVLPPMQELVPVVLGTSRRCCCQKWTLNEPSLVKSTNLLCTRYFHDTSYCCYSKATYIYSVLRSDLFIFRFYIVLILMSTPNVSNVSLSIHILSSRALRLTLKSSRRSTLCPGHCQNSQMSSFLYKFEIFFSDLLSALKQRPERQPC